MRPENPAVIGSESDAAGAAPCATVDGSAGGPDHIAIIMDGNHRWARGRGRPSSAGHRAGAGNVRPVAEACVDAGVRVLTLFAFSTENWHRPKREVRLLMGLIRNFLERDIDELHARGVKLRIIGDREPFDAALQDLMNHAERLTAHNAALTLNVAVNFGGRWDIVEAARALAREVQAGRLAPEAIDENAFARRLSLHGLPPPDLCIRTGGDPRISNFLLWDFAYAELYFTECFWPDFSARELQAATDWFRQRQRRFGGRP